jgi:hypothetical protein
MNPRNAHGSVWYALTLFLAALGFFALPVFCSVIQLLQKHPLQMGLFGLLLVNEVVAIGSRLLWGSTRSQAQHL